MTARARQELSAALRVVNSELCRLPISTQAEVDLSTNDLDRELDRSLLSGDEARALRAVESWREHHLALIKRAGNAR